MIDESFAYYYALQHEARARVRNALNAKVKPTDGLMFRGLTLCSILGPDVGDAIGFAEGEWPKFYGPETHHGFSRGWGDLAKAAWAAPDHFNLAIWQRVSDRSILVGLALGNPSHARTHLTLKWIERYFGPSPLAGRVLEVVLACAEEYAKLLGSERVLIKDPVDPTKYARYGYEPYAHPNVPYGGNYMAREVS